MSEEVNQEVRELFEQIQNWMIDNDYECGPEGSEIYDRISQILKKVDLS